MRTEPPAIPSLPMPDWTRLQAIPIHECGERLQPASLCLEWLTWPAYFHQRISGAVPECHLRQGVFDRLLDAARALPEGLQLVVLDGWRPFSVQQYLYDTLLNLMQHASPEMSEEELVRRARELVSPPSTDIDAPSPHLTGGAVDVCLADADGRLIDMGTLFDEASPLSFTAALEAEDADHSMQALMARHHRRILYRAMTSAGFTNLPSEWWHYDFGDQLWAWYSGEPSARYSATHLPSLEHLWQQQLAPR
ncbi:D-alanyl-D-alanine dipeptidase [Marinobacterium zhoushanense]|uniref:D-alanyl-D-alanine dipeptidase n=1 Tax=Marinobacterium zhoushanense TaxID=1679163 RepID=A0ABQ1KRY7_9GAMM|nr:M15 family metallopeptidase [Marinobacterium zhoushanense]GGC06061.1 D-alanyl-D-alanine dipeptidase [Marinobacterium zhoushanense]